MNDHFWPSLYPGIIVGLIIGLATGGLLAVGVGMVGGLVGSAGAYFLTVWLGLEDSPVSLAILIAGACAGGWLGAQAATRLGKTRSS